MLFYTMAQKRAHFVFAHNFDKRQPIIITFGKHTLQEISKKEIKPT